MGARRVFRWTLRIALFGALGTIVIWKLMVKRDETIEQTLIEQAQEEKRVGREEIPAVPSIRPQIPVVPPVVVPEPVIPELTTEGEPEKLPPEIEIVPPPPSRVASDDPDRAEKAAGVVLPELTPELKRLGFSAGSPVFIRVFKAERELEMWVYHQGDRRFRLFKVYAIAAMSGRLGPKLAEGDYQAPEGFYHVGRGRMNPLSAYHLAFDIGYPNAFDQAHSRTGSYIMVHGSDRSIGCFAMTDYGVEEIYSLAAAALGGGQKYFRVHIFPFRMTDSAMVEAQGHGWFDFWENLREGYLHFEKSGMPPETRVENKRYVFSEGSL